MASPSSRKSRSRERPSEGQSAIQSQSNRMASDQIRYILYFFITFKSWFYICKGIENVSLKGSTVEVVSSWCILAITMIWMKYQRKVLMERWAQIGCRASQPHLEQLKEISRITPITGNSLFIRITQLSRRAFFVLGKMPNPHELVKFHNTHIVKIH